MLMCLGISSGPPHGGSALHASSLRFCKWHVETRGMRREGCVAVACMGVSGMWGGRGAQSMGGQGARQGALQPLHALSTACIECAGAGLLELSA